MKDQKRLEKEPFFLVAELPLKKVPVKPEQLRYIPVKLQLQEDGSYRVLEWQVRAYGNIYDISKKTGIPRRALARLGKCGMITILSPTPFLHYIYYDEIEAFMKKIEKNPRFWDEVKTRAYLAGENIQEAVLKR